MTTAVIAVSFILLLLSMNRAIGLYDEGITVGGASITSRWLGMGHGTGGGENSGK